MPGPNPANHWRRKRWREPRDRRSPPGSLKQSKLRIPVARRASLPASNPHFLHSIASIAYHGAAFDTPRTLFYDAREATLKMGNIGVPELIVIFIIALLVFGPRKLPELGRTLGKALAEFRRASADLRGAMEQEMRELERHAQEIEAKAREAVEPEPEPLLPDGPVGAGSIDPQQAGPPPPAAPPVEERPAENPADGKPKPV